ncbi:hypothetical protein [Geobacter sp. DSM 9736]|uniref:hypothetical protein n=1 Tax=Geobacter sp. DSM 9736 TaxID=1277350 RepID=UPI000B4FFADA|nr:hypothetical protein [Geobacter sp. DSM 9736]SNB45933.1 hypothetical protein SAMN06269301_1367 [Geobacter sp. DSM 9736]
MGKVSNLAAEVQQLAAELQTVQNDPERLDVVTQKLRTVLDELHYEIEDPPTRLAKLQYRRYFNNKPVPVNRLACNLLRHQDCHILRYLIHANVIPALKKRGRWYATTETLIAYYKYRIEKDEIARSCKRAA